MSENHVNVFWFRRDLRLDDNVGLYHALKGKHPVLPIFIFDTEILNELPQDDARVSFIYDTLQEINADLKNEGSGIAIYKGEPLEVFKKLISEYKVQNVITNRDYEPYALERDTNIKEFLSGKEIGFYTYKDQVIFEKDEVTKADGTPYLVYTPYMNAWKTKFRKEDGVKDHPVKKYFDNLFRSSHLSNLSLDQIGFKSSEIKIPTYDISKETIQEYEETRNFPAEDSTSRVGPHLRFGTVSIRKLINKASKESNETFWQELIWREFFMQILWHFPRTVNNAFKEKYDRIEWRNHKDEFQKWKEGKTGYPMVDAGMRQLNQTGFMHNRVRMLTASFLCKHLLIDWRWGEAYFAEKLLDYEMASNVGNWQWAAGTGVDAAPYFRIFNPTTQLQKFDKERKYVKKWIPEFGSSDYPDEMVDHKEARERCLRTFKAALTS